MVLSFDFLPDLVKVVRGHEPSDGGTMGVEWRGKRTHFPAKKNLRLLETWQNRPKNMTSLATQIGKVKPVLLLVCDNLKF